MVAVVARAGEGSAGPPGSGLAQFEHFEWTLRPVVFPTHDHVTVGGIVPVRLKVARSELELDSDPLPDVSGGADATLGLAVGVAGPDPFDHVSEIEGNDAKEEDHALLFDRGMLKPSEVEKRPVLRLFLRLPSACLLTRGRSDGRRGALQAAREIDYEREVCIVSRDPLAKPHQNLAHRPHRFEYTSSP